jgi:hypothetical protein
MIDDIPETADWTGAVRDLFSRPETRQISIRISAADLIKSLLHEALENESKAR